MKSTWLSLIKISRPRFWLYLAGPFLIGWVVAAQNIQDFNNIWFIMLLIYFLWPANFYLYGLNDLFDLDTDIFNDKKDKQEIRLDNQSVQQIAKRLIIFCFFLAMPLVLLVPNEAAAWLLIIFLSLGAFYSVPPLRLKTKPIIDSIANILYALPGLIAYIFITNSWPNWPTWLALFSWTTAMHLFSAIYDIEADKRAGLKTGAVFFGAKKALWLCFGLWLLFAAITFIYKFAWPLNILFFIYPLIPINLLIKNESIKKSYWHFPVITGILGLITFWFFFIKLL